MSRHTGNTRREGRFPLYLLVSAVILLATSCATEEPVSYVSLGDSLAVGVGASEPSTTGYAPRFERHLEDTNESPVDLVQLGLSGETSGSFTGNDGSSSQPQLDRAVEVLRENPDSFVTLSIGANDLLAVREATNDRREAALVQYRENLEDSLTRIREASGGEADVTVLNVYNPVPGGISERWIEKLNDEIGSVSRQNGASVADVNRAFDGQETRYTDYPEDFHPNDRGYRAITEALQST